MSHQPSALAPRKILVVSFQSITTDGALGMAVFGLAMAEHLAELGHDVELVVAAVRGYRGRVKVSPVHLLSTLYLRALTWLMRSGWLSTHRKRYLEERLFDHFCRPRVGDDLDLLITTNSFMPQTIERARLRRIPVALVPGNPNDFALAAMTESLAARHHVAATDAYTYGPRQELYRRTVDAASLVVAYSNVIDRSFADLVPESRRRVHPALLKFKVLAAETRYPTPIVFGYLAYTVLLKGLDVLLAAWEQVYATTDARLMVGGGIDPSMRPVVEKYHAARDRYRIDFVTEVNDAGAFFSACSVVVVPSYIDGQPAVAVEAMALARPVVVTTGCGVADFVRDGENGLVVPGGDPDRLAGALRWFTDRPDRIASCGPRARATYDQFDFADYIRIVTDDILERTTHGRTREHVR